MLPVYIWWASPIQCLCESMTASMLKTKLTSEYFLHYVDITVALLLLKENC